MLSVSFLLILSGGLAPTGFLLIRRVEADGIHILEQIYTISTCFYRGLCRDKPAGEAAGNIVYLLPFDISRRLSPYRFLIVS